MYAWLSELGVEHKQFDKLVRAGLIERITIRNCGRGYYLRDAIEEHLLKPFRQAEERLAQRLAQSTTNSAA